MLLDESGRLKTVSIGSGSEKEAVSSMEKLLYNAIVEFADYGVIPGVTMVVDAAGSSKGFLPSLNVVLDDGTSIPLPGKVLFVRISYTEDEDRLFLAMVVEDLTEKDIEKIKEYCSVHAFKVAAPRGIDGFTGIGLFEEDHWPNYKTKPLDDFATFFHTKVSKFDTFATGLADDCASVVFGNYKFHVGADGIIAYLMCQPSKVSHHVAFNRSTYLISEKQTDKLRREAEKAIEKKKEKPQTVKDKEEEEEKGNKNTESNEHGVIKVYQLWSIAPGEESPIPGGIYLDKEDALNEAILEEEKERRCSPKTYDFYDLPHDTVVREFDLLKTKGNINQSELQEFLQNKIYDSFFWDIFLRGGISLNQYFDSEEGEKYKKDYERLKKMGVEVPEESGCGYDGEYSAKKAIKEREEEEEEEEKEGNEEERE